MDGSKPRKRTGGKGQHPLVTSTKETTQKDNETSNEVGSPRSTTSHMKTPTAKGDYGQWKTGEKKKTHINLRFVAVSSPLLKKLRSTILNGVSQF